MRVIDIKYFKLFKLFEYLLLWIPKSDVEEKSLRYKLNIVSGL